MGGGRILKKDQQFLLNPQQNVPKDGGRSTVHLYAYVYYTLLGAMTSQTVVDLGGRNKHQRLSLKCSLIIHQNKAGHPI